MNQLQEQVAYITGGTKGIGLGIAKSLINQGMRVAISGRSKEEAEKIAAELGTADQVIGIQSDVRYYEQEVEAIKQCLAQFGQLNVVIANAGLGYFAPIQELSVEQWHAMIDTNLNGVFHTTKAALNALIQSKGYLMTVSSLAGVNFFPTASGYNASKFGVVGFTQSVMLDVREFGIKTTTILPGSVATNFNNNTPGEKDAWKIQPEDIGQIVVDLLNMPERTLPSKVEVRPSFPKK